ncbi:kinesin [Trypanosoma theileri]|uniref:Rab3 GTPase-activating protein catalytic subunit n=1 Tax=Trypanosoma theileri TaxID=67003 RepID=A0A1X0NYB8_9TRYP|nr:kinesin [Trypanosoma theileri]ORC89672.1 kinesin [Trypanosoma theileri]
MSIGSGDAVEEIPLEIEDYSCNTYFEDIVGEIERYLVEEFRTRPELQRFLSIPQLSQNTNQSITTNTTDTTGEIVLGRNFLVGRRRNNSSNNNNQSKEDMSDSEGIAVEIHICGSQEKEHEYEQHPIFRLFSLPIFFLARSTTTASSYHTSESSYYLSLLTTAVSRVMRGPFSLHFGKDPSPIPSPFFYANGTAPCFVSIGDHYELAFTGVSPPSMITEWGGGNNNNNNNNSENGKLQQVISQPVVKCRFHCRAYSHPPQWCQRVADYLDIFQLQIGPQSRICTDIFDGISISLRRTFRLKLPRRFSPYHTEELKPTVGGRGNTLTWDEILQFENEIMLLSAGPTTFPFGTGTAPLRGVLFSFQWNQLHDTEVHDDGKKNSNLNPFGSDGVKTQNKLTIKAIAIPKKECELNHTACKSLSEYAYMVVEDISSEKNLSPATDISPTLDVMANEIIYSHTVSLSGQMNLLKRLINNDEAEEGETNSSNSDIRKVYFPGSLLCRFAYVCANRLELARDVYTLWMLVVDRLRDLLEGGGERDHSLQQLIDTIGIPPVEEIDHGLPLLVQKFQLLSYCARRMLRENAVPISSCFPNTTTISTTTSGKGGSSSSHNNNSTAHTRSKHSVDGWDEDTDELFSCETGDSTVETRDSTNDAVTNVKKRLITNGEPLIEPPALPTPPCTSDVLLLKAQELQNLGTASVGQQMRAWMQSEGLLNDMCLFLYANKAHEGRVVRFPDFVHWHSPRDFIPPSDESNYNTGNVEEDDMYLSERMRRNSGSGSSNLWWPLWSKAIPRSPEEIMALSFVPHEQARLIIRWMEKDLTPDTLLIETIHANFSNSLHRILSHRCVENNHAIKSYAISKVDAITNALGGISQLESSSIDPEDLRTTYAMTIRQIGELETSLCAAMTIERLLGTVQQQPSESTSTEELCTTMGKFAAALSSPSEEQEDPTGLTLREAFLSWDLWHRGGIAERFPENDQKPISMLLRATCMAERPLNTTACFQQMTAETDDSDVFRMALAISEEVL